MSIDEVRRVAEALTEGIEQMTFEDFQNTRRFVDNLGAAIADARWNDEPPATGYLYLDALYIELVGKHWPAETREKGSFYLLLGREEWISDDLTGLEHRLYDWACREGYCGMTGDENGGDADQ